MAKRDWSLLLQTRPETPTLSGGHQPGSMEALKQMLFRLQDEETATSLPTTSLPAAEAAHQAGVPLCQVSPCVRCRLV